VFILTRQKNQIGNEYNQLVSRQGGILNEEGKNSLNHIIPGDLLPDNRNSTRNSALGQKFSHSLKNKYRNQKFPLQYLFKWQAGSK
jgi:hypothetical protein